LQGNVAKKRNQRRGWRGFGWDMFQLFDFACFLFRQTFTATLAPQSAPDCNCEFSLTLRKSKKLEKRAMRAAPAKGSAMHRLVELPAER
jgi:hypothetical protein